jgi:transposase
MARFGDSSPRRRSPLKKIVCAAEQDRPDVAAERMRWQEDQKQLDPKRLVFIDETWAKTNMAPAHGRCRRGQRLYAKVPHGHWKTTTFVAALRHDGITAPFVLDGPINGKCFLAYVKEVLAPTLSPGDIVLIDNLASHKSPKIRKAIEAEGAELRFLPRYSPDLNPIEMAFSKLKTLLRKASERFVEALWSRIGELLSHFPQNECQNYFKAAGYEPT